MLPTPHTHACAHKHITPQLAQPQVLDIPLTSRSRRVWAAGMHRQHYKHYRRHIRTHQGCVSGQALTAPHTLHTSSSLCGRAMQQEQIQAEAVAWQQGTLICQPSQLPHTDLQHSQRPYQWLQSAAALLILGMTAALQPIAAAMISACHSRATHPGWQQRLPPLHVLTVWGLHPEPFRPARQTEPALPV